MLNFFSFGGPGYAKWDSQLLGIRNEPSELRILLRVSRDISEEKVVGQSLVIF